MGLHEILVAVAVFTNDRLMVDAQTVTDCFKGLGDIGPPAIRGDRFGASIPVTRGVHGPHRHPTHFLWEDDLYLQNPARARLQSGGAIERPYVESRGEAR